MLTDNDVLHAIDYGLRQITAEDRISQCLILKTHLLDLAFISQNLKYPKRLKPMELYSSDATDVENTK